MVLWVFFSLCNWHQVRNLVYCQMPAWGWLFAFSYCRSTSIVLYMMNHASCIMHATCNFLGMSLLSDTFPDDAERSKNMGIALGGMALGVLGKIISIMVKESGS